MGDGAGAGRFIYVVAAATAVGGLLFGYDTGIISAALLYIAEDFALGFGMQQIVVSAILVGAILGAMGSGRLSDRLAGEVRVDGGLTATAGVVLPEGG